MNYGILDVTVKIVTLQNKQTEPLGPAPFLLLADREGVLLKTADGYYLAVKNI